LYLPVQLRTNISYEFQIVKELNKRGNFNNKKNKPRRKEKWYEELGEEKMKDIRTEIS
jgi:hypothetical protein